MLRSLLAATAAICLAVPAYAQSNPQPLRVCSGGKSGNYFWAANEIARRLSPEMFSVTVLNTAGSLDNLRRLVKGDCDIAFSQSDVAGEYGIENPSTRDAFGLLRVAYTEYTHILCPTASGWTSLSDIANAKGIRRMIVGPDGSGTAETWRIMRQVDGKLYDNIERVPDPADYSSAHTVADSKDTCMLWVSGLNSKDMQSANQLATHTPDHHASMRLVSVDDPKMLEIKGLDGQPLYKVQSIYPHGADNGTAPLYDNLIKNGGWFSSASISVLAVPADIMIRTDYKQTIGRDKLARLLDAIDDAQPTIWAQVNPAGGG